MPPTKPPSQAVGAKAKIMRIIEANEKEALRSGYLTVEEAEADIDELFKELEADVAAGRIRP